MEYDSLEALGDPMFIVDLVTEYPRQMLSYAIEGTSTSGIEVLRNRLVL